MLGRMRKVNPLASCGSPTCSLGRTRANAAGEIVIGHTDERVCSVPIQRFASHLSVTGQPGMGKTHFVSRVIRQLASHGVSVLVLEPAKVEYGEALGSDAKVIGNADPGRERLLENPFAVDLGVYPNVWIQDVSGVLQDVFGMREQPLPLHLEALMVRLYRDRRIDLNAPAHAGTRWPTVRDFLDTITPYIRDETCAGSEVTQNIGGALIARGRAMCRTGSLLTENGLMANDLIDFRGVKVVQLSDIGPEASKLVGMTLLARILRASRLLGRRDLLHTVVVVEEAHSLFVDAATGEATLFANMYESALAELRASGVGFITVDQRPSLLPAGVLANSVSKVAFANTHGNDREAIAKALGLNEDQAGRFGALDVGRALFHTSGYLGPEFIRIP